jgi:ribonuclease HI
VIEMFDRIFYTDGSCYPNPGPGGWAVVEDIGSDKFQVVISGRDHMTTNIRMEGEAIGAAMTIAGTDHIKIYTDSLHWVNILTDYADRWEKRGWWKPGGVKNLDLVQRLFKAYTEKDVVLEHIRGHTGIRGNEVADEMAGAERDMAQVELIGKLRT